MIGGFIIGIAEALIKRCIPLAMADAIVFALLIVVLRSVFACWDALAGRRFRRWRIWIKAKWTAQSRRRNLVALVLGFALL